MGKRSNYYQVHRNKSPRKIKRPHQKISHIPLLAIVMANAVTNVSLIQASPFLDFVSKRIRILSIAVDAAFAIMDVHDKIKNQNPRKLYYESRFQKPRSRS
ncbi:hypothetical protein [Flavobacterium anhuiense]|uniref:hypothetical protein n=1 Tax=Flavobacterium anhuiense TaxID=459526 RepID=UPI002025D726|nr:hypothetical protein [Flavobacterium anhuiense]URM37169.1 hypothetical protein LLY39_00830 [Flavobacterium anhuiense]